MRSLITLLLLFTTFLSAGELQWEKDLETAFAKAKAGNRTVMVMVESTHCRWCKKMKEYTLSDDTISRRLSAFILVKIDRESVTDEAIPTAQYVPTIYFMTPQKKIIERVVGYFEVEDFNSWIDDVLHAGK